MLFYYMSNTFVQFGRFVYYRGTTDVSKQTVESLIVPSTIIPARDNDEDLNGFELYSRQTFDADMQCIRNKRLRKNNNNCALERMKTTIVKFKFNHLF